MIVTITFHLRLPGCASLKEKRGRIKPFINRLRREFNLSVAEVGLNDKWGETLIGCAMIGNDAAFLQSASETVRNAGLKSHWTDGDVWDVGVEVRC
jgi:uncharacterized protein